MMHGSDEIAMSCSQSSGTGSMILIPVSCCTAINDISNGNDCESQATIPQEYTKDEKGNMIEIYPGTSTLQAWTFDPMKTEYRTKRNRKYSLEEKEQAREMYRQSNITIKQLSRVLGVPDSTLRDWINERKRVKKEKVYFATEQSEKVEQCQSVENKQIADESTAANEENDIMEEDKQVEEKSKKDHAQHIVEKKEVVEKSKIIQKKFTIEEKKQAVKLYYLGNKTQKEVARQFNISQGAVSSWWTWWQNEMRDKSEKSSVSLSSMPKLKLTGETSQFIQDDEIVIVEPVDQMEQDHISDWPEITD